MWRRVSVQNYRSLADVTVDLAPFTVVVGPNGSGKSSFADVLVFAAEIGTDAASAVERRGGIVGLRRWSPGKPLDISVEIRMARSKPKLETAAARHLAFTIRSGRDGAWSFSREEIRSDEIRLTWPRSPTDEANGTARSFLVQELIGQPAPGQSLLFRARDVRVARPFLRVRRIRPNPDLMRPPRIADDRHPLAEAAENITVAFRSLTDERKEAVVRRMARIVPGLREILVDSFDRYLVLRFLQQQQKGKVATFSATEMSDGALRALGILTALAQATKDQLLVIEEPEVSVHPGAARLLYEALKEASRTASVLVITHSADLLDAASDEEILVCRYDEGISRIGPLAKAQREIVREGLFSLAELVRSEPLRIEGDEPQAVDV